MSNRDGGSERFVRHSGWRPWIIGGLGIAGFGAIFLYWYLGPRPSDLLGVNPDATTSSAIVALTVQGEPFAIPANFTILPRTRGGGEQDEVRLFALLPDISPYSAATAAEFEDTGARSRVIYLFIKPTRTSLSEAMRLERIFLVQVSDRNGSVGPAGLVQYAFRPTSSYAGNDLFVGVDETGGPAVFRCVQESEDNAAPDCFRDTEITPQVGLSYQFKRAHLEDWRRIDANVRARIRDFRG